MIAIAATLDKSTVPHQSSNNTNKSNRRKEDFARKRNDKWTNTQSINSSSAIQIHQHTLCANEWNMPIAMWSWLSCIAKHTCQTYFIIIYLFICVTKLYGYYNKKHTHSLICHIIYMPVSTQCEYTCIFSMNICDLKHGIFTHISSNEYDRNAEGGSERKMDLERKKEQKKDNWKWMK